MCCPRYRAKKQDGFNLVEAAIVLGIVGLVIGGIWIAAASVRFNQNINEMATVALRVGVGMRGQFPPGLRPAATLTSNIATPLAVDLGFIPASWPLAPGFLRTHPFGGNTRVSVDPSAPSILVGFYELTYQQCIGIAQKLSLTAKTYPDDILYILIVGTSVYQYNPSGAPAYEQAVTNCPATNGVVSVYFRL